MAICQVLIEKKKGRRVVAVLGLGLDQRLVPAAGVFLSRPYELRKVFDLAGFISDVIRVAICSRSGFFFKICCRFSVLVLSHIYLLKVRALLSIWAVMVCRRLFAQFSYLNAVIRIKQRFL